MVFWSAFIQATVVDPRGARPVEHATRDENCATQKDWPFCTDDDWVMLLALCCRIQGLMEKNDNELLRKIEKIRSLLNQHKTKHSSVDVVSKQTYEILREKLTLDSGNDETYYTLAQSLRQRITDMKIKIDRQQKALAALKDRVKDQVVEMQKLEVDIDMKLRSCKGSCSGYTEYQVDRESYVALGKQLSQLDSRAAQSVESVGKLYVMKSRPLKDVIVDSRFKSKDVAAQQKEDMFTQVNTVQFVLEEEGSSSSPATVSKVPGTSHSSSSSTSSSSGTSTSVSSSKSITELSGLGDSEFGFGGLETLRQPSVSHVSTKTVSCTKTIKRVIVHTKDGPVEKVEEVGGGPECEGLSGFTKGGMSSLFPTLTSTSSSSFSSFHSGGAKGSVLVDSKSSLDPFGADFGAFMTDNAEDDIPDFQARTVKSTAVERQQEFVGKDCVDAHQKHLKGETNGLFKIKPAGSGSIAAVEVYCHQEGLMGGWLLVQQRETGTVSFNRTWAEYRDGFGSVDAKGKGEFWLGNQNLHLLTNQGETMLKVELEDWEGGVAAAEYTVRVGTEEEGFPLQVSGYTGDAGDALESHSGVKFSTFDKDNDGWEENCAEAYGGGWWYHSCQSANLNGIYYKGSYDPQTNAPYKTTNGVRFKQQKEDVQWSASGTNMDRRQRCPVRSHLSMCSDDDWGLISDMESDVERKLQKFCQTAKIYENAIEKSMTVMTHIYNSNRRVIVSRYISERRFVERADSLVRNITELRHRSQVLAQKIKQLTSNVRKQLEELYRTEVDIDMKLRTCQGTCREVLPFSVDHHSFQTQQTDLRFIDKTFKQKSKPTTPPLNIPRVKLEPANLGPRPSAEYRKIPKVQKELLTQFEDIEQNHIVLVLDQPAEVNLVSGAAANKKATAKGGT
ncbi:hypothetical protein XENORESO_014894 [Xenotaenia resolanae]|uniref:Fibrinogen C-terminal domain-containing protein n=1 Tax=Xenotaenia resolanae TaxID=208358 RepID=A0ABV0VRZ7_9TELE